jgi:hypothetical protein
MLTKRIIPVLVFGALKVMVADNYYQIGGQLPGTAPPQRGIFLVLLFHNVCRAQNSASFAMFVLILSPLERTRVYERNYAIISHVRQRINSIITSNVYWIMHNPNVRSGNTIVGYQIVAGWYCSTTTFAD